MAEANTDAELVARSRDGDMQAFRQIVERHESAVAAVVIGMLGAGVEAEEVGQDTFVRFYRSMDRFRGDAALRTYLVRIAMNLSLNALKRRKRTKARFLSIEDKAEQLAATEDSPEEQLVRQDRARAVRKAIDGLDEKHRAVVTLRMIEGLSTREAAEALDVPEGTILSRLARGRKKLEGELGVWMKDDD